MERFSDSIKRKPLSEIKNRTSPPKKPKTEVLRKGNPKNSGTASSSKANLDDSFDKISSSPDSPSPPYKYQRGPVRKKCLRAKLPGQTCPCCEKFNERLDETEKQKLLAFSKHRDKWPRPRSPQGIWTFDFPTYSDD